MQTKENKKRRLWLPVLLLFLLAVATIGWVGYQAFMDPSIDTDEEYFYVASTDTYSDVMRKIEDQHIVKNFAFFKYVAQFMDLQENIKPGRYKLDRQMNNRRFVGDLRGGYQEAVQFRFQNVRLKESFAGLLGRNFEADSLAFSKMLNDETITEKYGFTVDNFFCMFIPNTYEIYWNTSPESIAERFNIEYNKFWNDERRAKAEALGMTTQEVCILASIVKGEAMHTDEMPAIAGLYINRLRKDMLLQADPTVIFANNDFTIRRVLNRHLTVDSPYNTYRYKGLPPGPIMMPSIAAIDAVLDYEHHEYIYMCAKDDFSGYHLFAKTMAEHLVNARKFQRALDERNIMR